MDSEISEVGWGGGLPGQELQLFSGQVKKKIREGEGHTSMAPDPTIFHFANNVTHYIYTQRQALIFFQGRDADFTC